jgi:hypothetical protein
VYFCSVCMASSSRFCFMLCYVVFRCAGVFVFIRMPMSVRCVLMCVMGVLLNVMVNITEIVVKNNLKLTKTDGNLGRTFAYESGIRSSHTSSPSSSASPEFHQTHYLFNQRLVLNLISEHKFSLLAPRLFARKYAEDCFRLDCPSGFQRSLTKARISFCLCAITIYRKFETVLFYVSNSPAIVFGFIHQRLTEYI